MFEKELISDFHVFLNSRALKCGLIYKLCIDFRNEKCLIVSVT